MNVEIANAMSGYLETLYSMNQKLIKLCGMDALSEFDNDSKLVLDIMQDIPRMVPYSYCNQERKLKYEDRNGLLEFKDEVVYLMDSYNDILRDNYDFLDKVRKIRNKYEHKMHGVRHKASGSGTTTLFDFSFEVCGEVIDIDAIEFIELIKMLNVLFSKIVNEIKIFAEANNKTEYLYYKRLTRFDYTDFNCLYESDLIGKIGRAFYDY